MVDDCSYGDSDDAQSDQCLLSTGKDDDDLSSIEDGGNEDLGDGGDDGGGGGVLLSKMVSLSFEANGGASSSVDPALSKSFWDPESALYKALQELVATHNVQDDKRNKCEATGGCRRRLATPSAAEAEAKSQEWIDRVESLLTENGTPEQLQIWKDPSTDHDGLVSVFFLPRKLGGFDCGAA